MGGRLGVAALERKLAELVDRLCREHAGTSVADDVPQLVAEARAGFASATVLDYLPVLIERAVRERLAAGAAAGGPGAQP